jgi:hypothetical protein
MDALWKFLAVTAHGTSLWRMKSAGFGWWPLGPGEMTATGICGKHTLPMMNQLAGVISCQNIVLTPCMSKKDRGQLHTRQLSKGGYESKISLFLRGASQARRKLLDDLTSPPKDQQVTVAGSS